MGMGSLTVYSIDFEADFLSSTRLAADWMHHFIIFSFRTSSKRSIFFSLSLSFLSPSVSLLYNHFSSAESIMLEKLMHGLRMTPLQPIL